jgi:hypothetical protein
MVLVHPAPDAFDDPIGREAEALIKEARRRRRRRWARRLLAGVVVLGVAAAVAAVIRAGGRSPARAGAAGSGALPNGPFATLRVAGALTVAPDGALYVTDILDNGVGGQRVLVRLHDGRFRVIAGTGTAGFSGDGGPAVRARLVSVSDLVFAPDGTLYLADGGRVRTIGRDGVIRTIAGDGRAPRRGQLIANGIAALSAPLGSTSTVPRWQGVLDNPLSIALAPATSQLYISTGSQILRLTDAGTLDTVRAVIPSGIVKGPLNSIGPIAIDAHGDIDVGSGDHGWSVWQVAPNGVAHDVGFARMLPGAYADLQHGPGSAIYASTAGTIARVGPHRLVPVAAFDEPLRGQAFPMTQFAFSPNGTIYADDVPGNGGFETHQQLRSLSDNHISLLWQENNAASR